MDTGMKRTILTTVMLAFVSSTAVADNFGDQVARCMGDKDYPFIEIFVAICEREVTTTNAIVDYLVCTHTRAPIVDDRISDVGNIAEGLHAACYKSLSQLEAFMTTGETDRLAVKARPKVIQQVLENRANATRKPAPQTKPRPIKPTT